MKNQLTIYILIFLLIQPAVSQSLRQHTAEKLFLEKFPGKENYFYYEKDTLQIKHGKYSFDSELLIDYEKGTVANLHISGTYVDGRKNNVWTYEEGQYRFNVKTLNRTNLTLNTALDGMEYKHTMRLSNGIPEGRWQIAQTDITGSRRSTASRNTTIQFKNGMATGNFNFHYVFDENEFKATGRLNEAGFLTGTLKFEYDYNGNHYEEERTYKDGFLSKLRITNKNSNEKIYDIEYHEVISRLNALDNNSTLNYKISEKGFGIEFNNGYQLFEPKLLAQKIGNGYFNKALKIFDKYLLNNGSENNSVDSPVYNFTRRFQFIYPETDDSMLVVIKAKSDTLRETYREYLTKPKFLINKLRSDSLMYSFAFIEKAKEKIEIIYEVIEKIESGFFDFQYRPNFYRNGIEGLNAPDTVKFEFNNIESKVPFDVSVLILKPENLLMRIKNYLDALEMQAALIIEFTHRELQFLQEEIKIDSLDIKIVELTDAVDSLYSKSPFIREYFSLDPKDKKKPESLVATIYSKFRIQTAENLSATYVSEDVFEKKIAHGEKLTTLLQILLAQYENFHEIERMPKRLDSMFTRYIPNPFFDRPAESRIKSNIYQRGAVRLLEYYVYMLKNADEQKDINARVEQIFKLRDRLIELAAREDEEVDRINKSLRRENVPERIKRILGV